MCLQVNNEYSDIGFGRTCKYKSIIYCNNFVSVFSVFTIKTCTDFLPNVSEQAKNSKKNLEL